MNSDSIEGFGPIGTNGPDYEDLYDIVSRVDMSSLAHDVNAMLNDGWMTTGGVFWDPKNDLYCQAIFKDPQP